MHQGARGRVLHHGMELAKLVVVVVTCLRITLIGAVIVTAASAVGNGVAADEKRSFRSDILFRATCAPCHGEAGAGDGPVAASIKGGVPRLDDLAKRYSDKYPADYVREMIDGRLTVAPHGTPEMPVWGLRFSLYHDPGNQSGEQADASGEAAADLLIEALVNYVATLQAQ